MNWNQLIVLHLYILLFSICSLVLVRYVLDIIYLEHELILKLNLIQDITHLYDIVYYHNNLLLSLILTDRLYNHISIGRIMTIIYMY